jgi:ABC-type lipoprotein export system ATPase subunit
LTFKCTRETLFFILVFKLKIYSQKNWSCQFSYKFLCLLHLDLYTIESERLNTYLIWGEKQRVRIARALANDPLIILADEPTGDMDSVAGNEVMAIISKLNPEYNKTIVCVTHDEEMLKPGMRLIRMDDGHIISDTYL